MGDEEFLYTIMAVWRGAKL